MSMHRKIAVQEEDFDLGVELAALRDRTGARAGAVASFVGLVREVDDDADSVLTLEHYPGMTERSLDTMVDTIAGRWPLLDVVVIHRVGQLPVGAQIVLVLAASAHRAAAHAAVEALMDYLKTDAVLWKHQRSKQGAHWVEATGDDRERRERWQGTDR